MWSCTVKRRRTNMKFRGDNRVYQDKTLYRIYSKQIEFMRKRCLYTRQEAIEEKRNLDYKFNNR